MSTSTPARHEAGSDVVEAVRTVCESVDEPTEIWEALESNGIDATPGIVYQAINEARQPESAMLEQGSTAPAGLNAQDIERLAELVGKAGGVASLTAVLHSMQHIIKRDKCLTHTPC
jgi:hypothetical protein